MRYFRPLSIAAVAATYILIVIGGIVRVTGSGLGCPDWPLCHGQFVPPPYVAAMIEFGHRLFGALTSGLILAVCVAAWLTRRSERALLVPATLMPILLAIQIGLGAVVVKLELPAMVVLVHLGFAMVILGLLAWLSVWSGPAPRVVPVPDGSEPRIPASLVRLVWFTTGLVLVLILSGAFVRALGASWACVGFPTCNGDALPFGTSLQVDIHLTHRLLAYTSAWFIGLSAYLLLRPARHVPAIQRTGMLAGLAVLVQIGIGAFAVTTGVPPLVQALHLAGAAAVWTSVIVLATLVTRASGLSAPPVAEPGSGAGERAPSRRGVAAAYLSLTKPRVMVLLLITTLASMMVAAGGMPALHLVVFTLIGGALASGGAGAINHYLDRDVDLLMGRTSLRPIPAGAVEPRRALLFGIGLGVLSFVILTVFVNLLSALLSIGALLFYVFVYTRWLKRTSPSNIVIGGAAGAIPPMVGVAAVQGEITLLALYLFAIVFFWTPPHFWALALLMKDEYARARIPMLPVVRGDEEARRQILYYSLQLVAITLILFSLQLMGFVYLVAALLLGGMFVYYAVRLWREASPAAARRLFRYSMLYLTLLFAAMVIDRQFLLRV